MLGLQPLLNSCLLYSQEPNPNQPKSKCTGLALASLSSGALSPLVKNREGKTFDGGAVVSPESFPDNGL